MPETATVQITMPEMGESVTEGIVLEWHVAEGDSVRSATLVNPAWLMALTTPITVP